MAMARRNGCGLGFLLAALEIALTAAVAALCQTSCAAWSTLIANGDPANRVDIVFLGDGYTQANIATGIYSAHIDNYLDYMFAAPNYLADPFPRYHKYFNVHKIDVVSNQSGADNPFPDGIVRDTALNATYDSLGLARFLTIDEDRANAMLITNLAGSGIDADIRLVTVNAEEYGGSGGTYAVFAGGNNQSRDIALHELSHSFSSTADEYGAATGTYAEPEPSLANVTIDPIGTKWSQWLGFDDPRGNVLDIGVFEGARGYAHGIYRPSSDSKMRSLELPFNAVVREQMILDIYDEVDPLDGWLANVATIAVSQLWVDVVDPEVISVDWYVNGELVAPEHGESFDLAEFRSAPGLYTIRAHAYDNAILQSGSGSLLDLVRSNLGALEQDVMWTVDFAGSPLAGDYNLNFQVDDEDFTVWKTNFGSSQKLAADGNHNGIVDAADYAVWRNQLATGAAAADFVRSSTPEPSVWQLTVVIAIVAGSRARRRRQQ
jgi:hypothetical protein